MFRLKEFKQGLHVKVINKKEVRMRILMLVLMGIVISGFVSAGVGIKWNEEAVIVNEGEKVCMNYQVYNPWPEESNVQIQLSDVLKGIVTSQESETKLVPANTASSQAIPINFCFTAPEVYEKDCLVGNFICSQTCEETPKVYDGDVLVKSIPIESDMGGGGSTTEMSVSAPLKVTIQCNAHSKDFTLVYVAIAIVCLIIILLLVYMKYRKPKVQRDEEKLKKLQEQIKRDKQKK